MTWYYIASGERLGPLDQPQFDDLIRQGVVQPETLVWRDGMPDWQPYSALAPANAALAPTLAPVGNARVSTLFGTCAHCGQQVPESDLLLIGGQKYCAACKQFIVQRLREGASVSSNAEAIRNQYLGHESSVRSMSIFYTLPGILFTVLGSLGLLLTGFLIFSSSGRGGGAAITLIAPLVLLLFGWIFWSVGIGLRRLQKKIRVSVAILSGLGLLGIPFGTLIHGYILYLVFSEKGNFVFSDEYQAVLAKTPHIKPRTSLIVVVIVTIFLLILFAGIFAAIFGKVR